MLSASRRPALAKVSFLVIGGLVTAALAVSASVAWVARVETADRAADVAEAPAANTRHHAGDGIAISSAASNAGALRTESFAISPVTMSWLTGDGVFNPSQQLRRFLEQNAGVDFNVAGSSILYDGSHLRVTQTPRNLERIRNVLSRVELQKLRRPEVFDTPIRMEIYDAPGDPPRPDPASGMRA